MATVSTLLLYLQPPQSGSPVAGLPVETLLDIFEILCQESKKSLRYYRPSNVPSSYPGFTLSHVNRRWRGVAFMCRSFWNDVLFHLPGTEHWPPRLKNQMAPRKQLNTMGLAEHALTCCGSALRLRITTHVSYTLTEMEQRISSWIVQHPDDIQLLEVMGTGASTSFINIANKLRLAGRQISSLRSFCLENAISQEEIPAASSDLLEFLPYICTPASGVRSVVFALYPLQRQCQWIADQLSLGTLPSFTSLPIDLTNTHLFKDSSVVYIINAPGLLTYAQGSALTILHVTCTAAWLGDDTMVTLLANVIDSSASTLEKLHLHGWIPFGNIALLRSLKGITQLKSFMLEFYISRPMVTTDSTAQYAVSYVHGVGACWRVMCQMTTLRRIAARCSFFGARRMDDRIAVDMLLDNLRTIANMGNLRCEPTYHPCRFSMYMWAAFFREVGA